MTYTTKYSCKDKVWFMDNNKPIEAIISEIRVSEQCGKVNIYYKFEGKYGSEYDKNEQYLYDSKELLLQSL